MQRPAGAPPQRPLSMNNLNFNRAASGAGGGGTSAGSAGATTAAQPFQQGSTAGMNAGYNSYLARPAGASGAAGLNIGGGNNPASSAQTFGGARGFPFGASNLPPHLAAFAGGQPGSGSAGGALNSTDFPALGGGAAGSGVGSAFGSTTSTGGVNLSYANSTTAAAAAAAVAAASRNSQGAGRGGGIADLSTDDFPALSGDGFGGHANGVGQPSAAAASLAASQEQASAAATLQHQRLAREQNSSQQALNAARGGFGGEPERNYATKVGMQQPPGMSAAQNWFSANFGGAARAATGGAGEGEGNAGGLNGFAQSPADAAQLAAVFEAAGGDQTAAAANNLLIRGAPGNGGTQAAPQTAFTPAQQVLTSPADRFGLLGLLSIIQMQDPDLTMLTLGTDLQQLGLNMNAQEPLSASLVTPWSDSAAGAAGQMEPEFHLPSCYNVQPPPPPQSKIASFSDETLFFIFYSTPRDVLQEVAAQELYNRNWRFYRGGLNLWLTKEENVQPTHKDLRAEKGVYVFWDPATWSKVSREFVLAYDALEERSMGAVSPAQLIAAQRQQGGGGGGHAGAGILATPGMASAHATAASVSPNRHQQPNEQPQQAS